MRQLAMLAFGLVLWQNGAAAQTPEETGVIGAADNDKAPEFVPFTRSERFRHYLISSFGPAAIARATAAGGLAQWTNSPKEWGGGAEAFGERIGNSYAKHVIRKTIEYGAATTLREDNRYLRSTEMGFWKRSKHAVVSMFTARNDAGREHFSYSRLAGITGSSFISRLWQPHSANTAGDAAVNLGMTFVTDIGWNLFREFRPRRSQGN